MRKDARENLQRLADLLAKSTPDAYKDLHDSPTKISEALGWPKSTAHATLDRLKAIAAATGQPLSMAAKKIHETPVAGVADIVTESALAAAEAEALALHTIKTSLTESPTVPITAPTAAPAQLTISTEAPPAPAGGISSLLTQAARDIEALASENTTLRTSLVAAQSAAERLRATAALKPEPAADVSDEDRKHVPAPIPNWTPMAIEPALDHCARAGWSVALVGPPGCGKSEVLRQTAARLGRPYVRIACSDGATVGDIIGRREVADGATKFQLGPFPKGATRGYALTLDEVGAAPAPVLACTHDLAATGQMHIPATGETIHAVNGWWLTATSNFLGSDRVDTTHEQPISAALADRFVVFQVDYGDDTQEAELAKRVLGLSTSSRTIFTPPTLAPTTEAPVGDMAGLLSDLRAAEKAGDVSGPYSRRRLIDMVRLWLAWGSNDEGKALALRGALLDRHPPSQQEIVKGLIQRRLGVAL